MLSDSQTLTVATVDQTLAAIKRGNLESTYREAGGQYEMVISTTEGKRTRTSIRVNHNEIAADPLTEQNSQVGASVYLVVDRPNNGVFTITQMKDDVIALADWLKASSAANLVKVLGGES